MAYNKIKRSYGSTHSNSHSNNSGVQRQQRSTQHPKSRPKVCIGSLPAYTIVDIIFGICVILAILLIIFNFESVIYFIYQFFWFPLFYILSKIAVLLLFAGLIWLLIRRIFGGRRWNGEWVILRNILKHLKIYIIIVLAIFLILCLISLIKYWYLIEGFIQEIFSSFFSTLIGILLLIAIIVWLFRKI